MEQIKLERHKVGSCNCMTKTPEAKHHDELCYYRLIKEKEAHSSVSSSAGLWRTIDTAPKDNRKKLNYILIAQSPCMADLVMWHDERPERVVNDNRHLAIPEGWFAVSGSRSRVLNPTHWMPLPDAP